MNLAILGGAKIGKQAWPLAPNLAKPVQVTRVVQAVQAVPVVQDFTICKMGKISRIAVLNSGPMVQAQCSNCVTRMTM